MSISVECEDQPATLYCEQCLDNYCEVHINININ